MQMPDKMIKVWDPIVRIGHWSIVAGFLVAYLSEDEFLSLHVWAGYVVAGVVAFRLLWGLVGTRHARFRDFLYSPATVIAYLKGLIAKNSKRHIGHSPAGGAMIIMLLLGLLGTSYTGLKLYAVEENAGPLAALEQVQSGLSSAMQVLPAAMADDDRHTASAPADEDAEEFWEELHELFANATLLLVLLHVAGVFWAGRVHRENLVKAMFTGRKRRD